MLDRTWLAAGATLAWAGATWVLTREMVSREDVLPRAEVQAEVRRGLLPEPGACARPRACRACSCCRGPRAGSFRPSRVSRTTSCSPASSLQRRRPHEGLGDDDRMPGKRRFEALSWSSLQLSPARRAPLPAGLVDVAPLARVLAPHRRSLGPTPFPARRSRQVRHVPASRARDASPGPPRTRSRTRRRPQRASGTRSAAGTPAPSRFVSAPCRVESRHGGSRARWPV